MLKNISSIIFAVITLVAFFKEEKYYEIKI